MKWIRYSKYTGEDFGIDAEDLLKALADFLLESGFNSQYMPSSSRPTKQGRPAQATPNGN